MERAENIRKRMRALDGTSFRFERKGDDLFVNGMPAQACDHHATGSVRTENKV